MNLSQVSADDSRDGDGYSSPPVAARNLMRDTVPFAPETIVVPDVAACSPHVKKIEMSDKKRHEVFSIHGDLVDPPVVGPYCIETPHVSVSSKVVSPFHPHHKKISPWWIFYSTLDMSLTENKGTKLGCGIFCNLCGKETKCSASQSSTPLKNHIDRYHHPAYIMANKKWNLDGDRLFHKTLNLKKKVSADDARKIMMDAMTRFIVEKNLPFDTVEDDEFRRLIRKAASLGKDCPTEVSNKAVKGEISDMRRYCTAELSKLLKGKTCHLTTDHWTDKARRCFEGTSVQYITEDCILVSHDLECKEYQGTTQAHIMYPKFKTKMSEDWRMKLNASEMMYVLPKDSDPFLGQATTDTEGKMNKLGQLLEEDSRAGHGYCTDHVIQLTAQVAFHHKFLKCDAEGEDDEANVLKKLRELSKLFQSNQKNEILLKVQKELEHYSGKTPVTTVNDCKTRWWSTCSMVERALHLRKAFEKMEFDGNLRASDDKVDAPSRLLTPKEWSMMECLQDLLKPFKTAQQTLEGVSYVTSSLVHCTIDCLMGSLLEFDFDEEDQVDQNLKTSVKECAQLMGEHLLSQWGDPQFPWNNGNVKRGFKQRQVGIHPNFILAMALDPRFKSLISIHPSQHESIKNHLVGEMVKARKQTYNIKQMEETKAPVVVVQPSTAVASTTKRRRNMGPDRSSEGMFAKYAKMHRVTAPQINAAGNEVPGFNVPEVTLDSRQELERYFSSTGIDMVKEDNPSELEDPLPWWAVKKALFPNVWILAKFYLGIPATSANSERCFSFSNRLLSAHRTQMNARVAEDTFFVHRNFNLLPHSPSKPTKKRKASSITGEETIEID